MCNIFFISENTTNKINDDKDVNLIIDDDDGSDDDFDVDLVYEEEEISTSHLKEFECTRKPRKKKKKQKPKFDESGVWNCL